MTNKRQRDESMTYGSPGWLHGLITLLGTHALKYIKYIKYGFLTPPFQDEICHKSVRETN